MGKISKNIHDDRFSQADRIEIYKKVMTNPISTLASPEQYARVPLEGMPDPDGEVYRDDKEDFLTNRNAFVNDEYKTHSQATELYMTQPGLDFHKFNPGEKLQEAKKAAIKYEKKQNELKNQNIIERNDFMLKNEIKTMDDRIIEKIFHINDGLYEIPISIGNLFVNKQTIKDDREHDYDNKKIQINIYKDNDTIYSKYSKDYRYYLGTGDLGGYGNYDRQYAIDFPEIEFFKNLKFKTYGYDRKNDEEIIVYLDNDNNKQYRIVSDGIRLYEGNSIMEFYEIQNDRIVINNSIAIDINTSDIFVNINDKFVKINSNDNIEEKLISYVNKLRVLKKYLQEDMKEIYEIINIDYDLKIGKDNSLSIKDCKILGEKLKDMRLLYLDASKIINYKHDEQVKWEIASGLNEYYQDRASCITVDRYMFADGTKNIDLINKLVKLNNGFYFVNTPNGIIGIDVNLDKDLEIIFNDEVIFEMSYGKIYKNTELEKNVVELVSQNIDRVLEQQQNKQKVINELDKEREIKILEKRLHELRNS